MSDDIPPLIPETPPPMTKLAWEEDEDFMDFPHLALEMPSESSLSPDGEWNPIDVLSLPYEAGDVFVEPVSCIESSTIDTSSNQSSDITKNDQCFNSEKAPSLNQNMSIWKDKKKIVPWENIKKLTSGHSCDSVYDVDCKRHIKHNTSFENVIDSNRQIIDDDLSAITVQHTCDIENVKNNMTQCLPMLELQSNDLGLVGKNNQVESKTIDNPEQFSNKETLVNGHLESDDIKELSNQTNCVPNVLLENSNNYVSNINDKVISSNGIYTNLNSDLTINNNNNNTIEKKDQEEYTEFCDFETTMPNSVDVPLPNRTAEEHNKTIEICQSVDYYYKSNKITIEQELNIENVDSINYKSSTFQNNEIHFEENLNSEFDEFCDFHDFSTSTSENKPICVTTDYDISGFETGTPKFSETIEFKHSDIDHAITEIDNDNVDNDDDNFCDFESGVHTNHEMLNVKQTDVMSDSKFPIKLDYKQLCMDAFQGNYDLCEEVSLQNLDSELSDSQVWQNLKDVESSPALNYNWSKSESNNVFLSSLSIDSRNILYGASWNPKVPRFAANMSNNPLEPLKASNNDYADTKISQSFSNIPLQETVPDPEFDWQSSGLINPLDCNHTSLLDLELLDTLTPCCTNTLQPQTWKTFDVVKKESIEEEETPIQSSPESIDVLDEFFSASLPSLSDNQSIETIDSPIAAVETVSLEAQIILDNLPDLEVLQKPYLVILEKGDNNLFFH